MKQYYVTGMRCAACSTKIEKAVSSLPGVTECAVSLLTNSMGVEGTAAPSEIIHAVEAVGYGASLKDKGIQAEIGEDLTMDTEIQVLKKRLLISLGFLCLLLYITMGQMIFSWPLPEFLKGNYTALGLLQLLLSGIIMVINQRFFINGFNGVLHLSPNMDTLVSLGSMTSFVWSVILLFMITDSELLEPNALSAQYYKELYFESAAMILVLITVGKMLEAYSKGKTTDALNGLMNLTPKTANIIVDSIEKTVSIKEVAVGDLFIVRPGESIPADGIIIEGITSIDESVLTGESLPADKKEGDAVTAATINHSGSIICKAVKIGEDTKLSQIIKLMEEASATKAPIARIADKVSGVFIPTVIAIALITFIIWLTVGENLSFALARGISVLVISCPCALGLATPVAIMVGHGVGARNGILFKTAEAIEEAGKTQIVVFDKTGTITVGKPCVTDIITEYGVSEKKLLSIAASLENRSEHSFAKAILSKADEYELYFEDVHDFEAVPGKGITAALNDCVLYGGNYAYISGLATISPNMKATSEKLSDQGKTPLFFAQNDHFLGIIAVADIIKKESPRAISELKKMGIRVLMLTGDNRRTAETIGESAGVDTIVSEVLPDEKEMIVRKLQQCGTVMMVGDGINDAPALKRADIGMAVGSGTDIAIDAADIVLIKNNILDVPATVRLSRSSLKNIRENLFWAFFYNILCIPLAAGVYISLTGIRMSPVFAAAAMSLSSFCVVTNALRLNFCRIYESGLDKKIKPVEIPSFAMKKKMFRMTFHIDGMMCTHCEATVKNILEEFDEVDNAAVSFIDGTAKVVLNSELDENKLREAIESEDYSVLSIENN